MPVGATSTKSVIGVVGDRVELRRRHDDPPVRRTAADDACRRAGR